jgi:xanthine dehydrogenase YagS FAD-binding subunit
VKRFEFVAPTSLASALAELKKPGRVAKAGGVDLVDLMKEGLVAPERVVSLNAVPELRGVRETKDGGLAIGALTTLAEIAAHDGIRSGWTALALAATHAATPQLRNMATLGGNLVQRPRCWYFRSDEFRCRKKGGSHCFAKEGQNAHHAIFGNRLCAIVHPSTPATALTALGATVHLARGDRRRAVAIKDFFVDPDTDVKRENVREDDEIITHVELAPLGSGWRSVYHKQGHRESYDWPLADVAIAARMSGDVCETARVALGAAAPVPMRAEEAEKAMRGQRLTPEVRARVAQAAMRRATPLALNGYKVPIFDAVVRRLLEELIS